MLEPVLIEEVQMQYPMIRQLIQSPLPFRAKLERSVWTIEKARVETHSKPERERGDEGNA